MDNFNCSITLADVNNKNTFNNIDFRGCTFFKKKRFTIKSFINCNFEAVKLNGSIFIFSSLKDSNFKRANLNNAHLKDADLTGANLDHATLDSTNLENTILTRANLEHARTHTTNFINSYLEFANLTHAYLFKANFTGADLTDANCTDAKCRHAKFTNATLRRANFTRADLGMSNFTGADLTGANLTGANLKGAVFTRANLTGVIGADLTGAIIPITNLALGNGTDLTGALQQEQKTKDLLKNIKPIVPHPIDKKHIKEIKNTFSNNVFDMSMAMEIPISEIDDEEDNVIFYIDNQPTGFLYPREQLKNAYNDYTSVFIACNKLSASAVSINIANKDIFIRINLTMNFFINLKDMTEVLSTNHKEWLIQDTGKIEKFTASILNVYDTHSIAKIGYLTGADGERFAYSHNIMNTRLNTVSGDHCQDGTTQRIYKITPIKLTIPNIRIPTPIASTPNSSSIYAHPMSYIPIDSMPTPLPLPLPIPIPPPRGKRCPKGSRKNKITGNCDPNVVAVVAPAVVAPAVVARRCPNGTRKNKRTGKCDPH